MPISPERRLKNIQKANENWLKKDKPRSNKNTHPFKRRMVLRTRNEELRERIV